jgi:hypothetical protein
VEPKPDKSGKHKNKTFLGHALSATGKGVYANCEEFSKLLDKKHAFPILLMTGEFDPNLIASPGGPLFVVNYTCLKHALKQVFFCVKALWLRLKD